MTFHFRESIKSSCKMNIGIGITEPILIKDENSKEISIMFKDEVNIEHSITPIHFNKMQFKDEQNKEIDFKDIDEFIEKFNDISKKPGSGEIELLQINDGKFLKFEIVVTVSDLNKFI